MQEGDKINLRASALNFAIAAKGQAVNTSYDVEALLKDAKKIEEYLSPTPSKIHGVLA